MNDSTSATPRHRSPGPNHHPAHRGLAASARRAWSWMCGNLVQIRWEVRTAPIQARAWIWRRRIARSRPLARQPLPVQPSGYWHLQTPLSRGAEMYATTRKSFYAMTTGVCAGVIASMKDCETVPTEADRARWVKWHEGILASNAATGFTGGHEPPRWHWRKPLVRVPAGSMYIPMTHFSDSEVAMWDGGRRGYDIQGPELPHGWRLAKKLHERGLLAEQAQFPQLSSHPDARASLRRDPAATR